MDDFKFEDMLMADHPEELLERAQPFMRLMMQYRCALLEIETKLKVLDSEFALHHNRNPIEAIKSRVKSPLSIIEKLKRKKLPMTAESIENGLSDIAGIRVICSFPEDIYTVARLLIQQDDVTLIAQKDYIASPKENGYRSLHLIVGVPIFLAEGKKMMRVEVQLRTIAMDFWASLEHKVKYKQNIPNAGEISAELKECAETIAAMDVKMQDIRSKIDAAEADADA